MIQKTAYNLLYLIPMEELLEVIKVCAGVSFDNS